ncbi:hypothetical protein UFOVP36_54 [uncultured Caudovirales phage]|uniref:Uncharacterized protein n=1 Tax=uncultured Caudovirales phage TaxID=2100421 RepID=A0A6J5KR09_9CAUD|nr:hypothetical protein UFOVP36_54 [uncultured Caudovirales phage]
MTKAEMNRRLATMTPEAIEQISDLVREGWGGHGIFVGGNPHRSTMKQINAVFALRQPK